MGQTLNIPCKACNSKAIITRSVTQVHAEFIKLYCTCKNSACNHHFVMNLEFSHTTQTSLLIEDGVLEQTAKLCSSEKKQKLIKILQK
ncbi:ogr/Delta-like zinc finger family protein [Pasteurella sp. PK-2025]|uniref:ogr/Delta-like zinc finger family protein n=1 Tax=Pasteurella sp. PK-2025 TaxID=3413133 RepID=UPI003C71E93B